MRVYPIVRTTTVGRTHYLRVSSLNPAEIASATKTLCNSKAAPGSTLEHEGALATCKRCLKIAAMNEANDNAEAAASDSAQNATLNTENLNAFPA